MSHIIKWCMIAFYEHFFSSSMLYMLRLIKINGTIVFVKRTRKFLSFHCAMKKITAPSVQFFYFSLSLIPVEVDNVIFSRSYSLSLILSAFLLFIVMCFNAISRDHFVKIILSALQQFTQLHLAFIALDRISLSVVILLL